MENWRKQLRFDPLPPLMSSKSDALRYFASRDLLKEALGSVENLWQLQEVERIFNRQLHEGSWKYPGSGKEHLRSTEDYNQIEIFRVLGLLVEKHGLNNKRARS